ncbi:MAG: HD domain-containing protein [Cyanobacteria bacterium SIG26]|nr:HD domain-containing protein [Cyanobacteria bacterium SIG26]
MTKIVNSIEMAESKINQALIYVDEKNYTQARELIEEAYKFFQDENLIDGISICLSLIAFLNYSEDKNGYENALELLNDATFMSKRSNNESAILINELMLGNINFSESNKDIALIHYNNALKIAVEDDKYSLVDTINTRIRQLQNGMDYSLPTKSDPLVSLVKISRSITALTDIDELLRVIAEETKNAISADRCTVFLWDKDTDELWSKVALGLDSSQEIRFPADKGLAGYVVKSGETLNIIEAYDDPRFNPEVDKKTGYRTKTILCMPIINNNQEIIGAFQVINKIDGVFTKNDEDLLIAIGGSASIALENAQLFDKQLQMYHEQKLLFESFIDTLATSIDARDKITAGHSTRVRQYSTLLAQEMNMEQKDIALLEKAALLHDIGKIGIRDSVLQKDGKLTDEEYKHIQEHVRITHNILNKIYMSSDFRIITEMACSHHEKWDGSGYYRHLKGEEITLGGRILAVADVFDAITSKRHYRDKMPIANVIDILMKGAGSHFEESLVNIFLSVPANKIVRVFLSESNGEIKPEDERVLSAQNLREVHRLSTAESLNENEQKILDLFNAYYTGIMGGGK